MHIGPLWLSVLLARSSLRAVTKLQFDDRGLIPAIAQDRLTGEVRMMAWMNHAAVEATLATGKATFFSRSRQRLWVKGESSGNTLRVLEVRVDCDADTLLLLVDPEGPSCHTGAESCFFQLFETPAEHGESDRRSAPAAEPRPALPPGAELWRLEREIERRSAQATAQKSYTRHLLEGGVGKINEKITEEAGELCQALDSESPQRVASEAADLVYHLLVGLRARGVRLKQVAASLAGRSGQSGHAEKASRGQ